MSSWVPTVSIKAPVSRRNIIRMIGSSATLGVLTKAYADTVSKETWLSQAKFYPTGKVRPYQGNTIICPLPQHGTDSFFFNALVDCYRDVSQHFFSQNFTLLPPSSYHMTVFEGTSENLRTKAGWPDALPRDTSMQACDVWIKRKLSSFILSHPFPIQMKIAPADASIDGKTLRVRLMPADETVAKNLHQYRRDLADFLGMHDPALDNYVFHASLAYQIRSFKEEQATAFRHYMLDWQDNLARTLPSFTLGRPAFCFFSDMFSYQKQFFVG